MLTPQYLGIEHVFTTRSATNNIRLKAGSGKTLTLEGNVEGVNVMNVSVLSDFPAAQTGIITLGMDQKQYFCI